MIWVGHNSLSKHNKASSIASRVKFMLKLQIKTNFLYWE